ncbi:hypothetical protein [Lactiplantibacillus mudanjiangensis]|uniref:Integral membrane protein (Putative) [Lactobacillus plantarum JDM1] n=1 Tax=Lactiplantibacillus mudanjiangensis TaxID=1296538 RepID=A0A660E5B8_9LACO|nr:hypothetical protein [Lactiplantibacillus mudanjiangensis]VDG20060.1 integral membrane protein (putative) [Lactobacillus plantarum JDM1] [Lactiplantibacillus mudanjiangensis]VDG26219.1 integral membrane protein (putative) [Lactobacillus plantarum JDM1] [Lactiplantibacillus mudanjiangensis]VDG27377.1 integral membrane protein (putative) [Lactobacillus plantarum JDM1] [Lactiplantibacillus mudanjiangensis]VDG33458.1 integral membrane protein (putative) [Lactobacillus plantarum JDM1] [Lactiplant
MGLLTLGVITVVLLGLEEWLFTASHYFWVGGIVPILWTVALAVLVIQNAANLTLIDYFLAIIAVISLYVCWGNGFQRHATKRAAR